jgi:hypothetical protein
MAGTSCGVLLWKEHVSVQIHHLRLLHCSNYPAYRQEDCTLYNTLCVYNASTKRGTDFLKGLSLEIFGPGHWPVWMHLGLNKNRFWFINFKEAPSIWDSLFKFCCVSVQTLEKVWQLSPRFSEIYLNCHLLLDTLMLLKNILGEPRTVANPSRELGTQLPILLGDSTNFRELFTL